MLERARIAYAEHKDLKTKLNSAISNRQSGLTWAEAEADTVSSSALRFLARRRGCALLVGIPAGAFLF
jgi:hypothetical protein